MTLPEEELAAQAEAAARAIRTPPPRPAPAGPNGVSVPPTPTAEDTAAPDVQGSEPRSDPAEELSAEDDSVAESVPAMVSESPQETTASVAEIESETADPDETGNLIAETVDSDDKET